MPFMDGFQLAHKLLQKRPQCQGLFYDFKKDNMNAPREVHPLKSIGCFIKKPITAERLLRRIRAELE
jgi:response regulator RpfG family c-di-GMP phosphodiesterase